jgi:multidrug efflux pump subunit AcrA (membrane-fusion protein)
MALVSRVSSRTAVLLVAGALVLPLTAASCGDDPVRFALGTASRSTVAEIVDAPGSVTARSAATLTAPADGTLAALRVESGDRVRKGQVVAVIDSPSTQKRLADAERAVDEADRAGVRSGGGTAEFTAVRRSTDADAEAAFDDARDAADELADADLKKALLTQVDAAEQQYAAASRAVDAAVRSVQRGVAGLSQAMNALTAAQRLQARQAYQLADAAADALTLRAPVAGVVQLGGTPAGGTRSLTDLIAAGATGAGASGTASGGSGATLPGVDSAVPIGAVVSAGTPVVTIVDTARLGLVAEVDETDVLLVQPGGTATVELDAATGATYAAVVSAVDLLPTTSARGGVSYRVRLTLKKGTYPDGRAAPTPRPGMSAIVRLQVRQATDAITVPASAVFTADGRDTVWAVRSGKAERVAVTLGVQGEDAVQVVSGLDDGQQIVVGGTDQVRAGQQVR